MEGGEGGQHRAPERMCALDQAESRAEDSHIWSTMCRLKHTSDQAGLGDRTRLVKPHLHVHHTPCYPSISSPLDYCSTPKQIPPFTIFPSKKPGLYS